MDKPKIVILGGSSFVGSRFIKLLSNELDIIAPSQQELDVANEEALTRFLNHNQTSVVINFAAWTNVDKAEEEASDKNGMVYKLNSRLPENLAKLSKMYAFHLIHLSTGYVFDGTKSDRPYHEGDIPNPLGWYGQTKYFGEQLIQEVSGGQFTIARIEMPYASFFEKKKDLARSILENLRASNPVIATTDQYITPVFLDDCVKALGEIVKKPLQGIVHIASTDNVTPFILSTKLADLFGLDKSLVKSAKFADYSKKRPAPRPQNSWLDVSKFEKDYSKDILETVDQSLVIFKKQIDELN